MCKFIHILYIAFFIHDVQIRHKKNIIFINYEILRIIFLCIVTFYWLCYTIYLFNTTYNSDKSNCHKTSYIIYFIPRDVVIDITIIYYKRNLRNKSLCRVCVRATYVSLIWKKMSQNKYTIIISQDWSSQNLFHDWKYFRN